MKKIKKNITTLIVSLAIIILVAFISIPKLLVTDRSAVSYGNGIIWNDVKYIPTSAGGYHEKKTVAKTSDGWNVVEIKEDPSHTFIVQRSFLDNYLLVDESYVIPKSGKITSATWNDISVNGENFLTAISEILENAEADFYFELGELREIYSKTEIRPLYIGYEDCPLSTEFAGYIGIIDNKWCITTERTNITDDSGAVLKCRIFCYEIPEEYYGVLEKYLT